MHVEFSFAFFCVFVFFFLVSNLNTITEVDMNVIMKKHLHDLFTAEK